MKNKLGGNARPNILRGGELWKQGSGKSTKIADAVAPIFTHGGPKLSGGIRNIGKFSHMADCSINLTKKRPGKSGARRWGWREVQKSRNDLGA